ncbi:HTH domain-containing protein, partial [Streptococcus thermophilus]|nr:HTH domain-containing protein [Streptococcus thermophilus]
MTLNRKQELLTLLKQSKEAINGQSLAEHFGVTR